LIRGLTIELEPLAAVQKTTVAEANLFESFDLIELMLLANSNTSRSDSYTFSVLSSQGCSVIFIADVWRTSSPASMASSELMGTGIVSVPVGV
jgi:hypothetical protein